MKETFKVYVPLFKLSRWYLPSTPATALSAGLVKVMVVPGSASPVCWLVIFPEIENWAAARTGSNRAINAANDFFKMINK